MSFAAPLPGPDATVTAILGPTNTGKTHYAIERMLGRADGVIGLPLRLLAREVYDKIVGLRGPSAVALVTGEEKIAPPRARYVVCTVEAMPTGRQFDFVAIDEVQMCADPERGHVFTDRLLRARGRYETLFLGSDAARPRIAALVPKVQFVERPRYSTLSWAGSKKISRLKPRSAVVAFSIDQVYAIAELIRRQRGGAAVVMGALSPRTRNAQVALYQQGDVDYLVATDAIGMGLNLDVDHIAFAGLSKFDGRRVRALEPNELAQIAGRAGRFKTDGTFGVTGEAPPIDEEVVAAIEGHRFKPIQKLMWRSPDLDFGSVERLQRSLEVSPGSPDLMRAREAEDQIALRTVTEDGEIRALATRPDRVRLLWEVCGIPDFRKVAGQDHAHLIARIYRFLLGPAGVIPSDWIADQVKRIDRTNGDIDTLAKRLAYIRTWTFVANRADWLEDAGDWQATTRAVEDRLSDALHERLTQRFVDRRTSVLLRRLKQKERLVAEVNENGEVTVEGEFVGRLDGFRFTFDETATPDEAKTLRSASMGALAAELARRSDKLYLAPDQAFDMTEQGGLIWDNSVVGQLVKGDSVLVPKVRAFVDDLADPAVAEKIERRLTHWIERRIAALFEPLIKLRDDETVTGLARGVGFQLVEHMGVIPRRLIADDVKALGQDERAQLRRHGVRFGQHTIFMGLQLKPAPTALRLLLWGLWEGHDELPVAQPPGHVTVPRTEGHARGYWDKAGYKLCGQRAVRIDMLERLADMIRPLDARAGFEATPDMLSITGCTLDQLSEIMQGLGFEAEKGERAKAPRPPKPPKDELNAEAAAAEQPAETETTAPKAEAVAPDAAPTAAEDPATETPAETPAEAPKDEAPAEAPETAMAESTPPAETEAAEPVAAAASEVPADPTPEVESAAEPTPAPEAGAEAPAESAAETPSVEAAEQPAEQPAELEVFYTFTLRPRRPQGQGGGRRRRGPDAGGQRGGQAGGQAGQEARQGDGQGEGQGGEPSQRERRGPPRGKPRNKDQGKTGGKPEHAGQRDGGGGGGHKGAKPDRKGGKHGQNQGKHGGQKPSRRDDRPIDPDSPFAILQQLKNK
ncbi:MAG: helicase-related protein [Pseudomonadota bacterium]